jgi:hypothetical protein
MFRPLISALVMIGFGSSVFAAPAAQAPRLPAAVQGSLQQVHKICLESGGTPGKSPDLIKVQDLNGDGLADYVIYLASYVCDGAASAVSSGQSGDGVSIFVGQPAGTARLAFEDTVYNVTVTTAAGRSTVAVDVAGLACGQRNAAQVPFSQIRSCTRNLNWDAPTRKFVYAPLSQARMIR